nr:immunoglobulin heavy chain junction region [Macaca mulatta]MOX62308.1 immunoglobulin heavy chain junction region [Macaca mulatta]MOX66543.1 immunoglobulin heavy chain junction region [Macaca mulatta]
CARDGPDGVAVTLFSLDVW